MKEVEKEEEIEPSSNKIRLTEEEVKFIKERLKELGYL